MTATDLSPIEKAVAMYTKGSTPKQVSDALGVPEATARTWKARHYQNENSISNLETQIQDLKHKSETNETEIQNLKRKIQSDETEFQKLKRKIQSDETEIQNLKRKIQADETEIQKLNPKIQADETEIQNLKRKIQADETEIQNLKRKIQADETEIQKAKLSETEKEKFLKERHQKEIESNRQQYKLIHDAALQKAIADERKVIEAEKRNLQMEAETKLEREKAALQKQYSGSSSQQIQSEKLNASLTAKAEIAEAKAKLVSEFDTKTSEKVEQERQRCEAVFLKEKRQLTAKHQADTEGWVLEKETLLADKEKAIEAAEAEKSTLLDDKNAIIEAQAKELEAAKAEIEKLSWKKKLPSLYDVVNITSNGFALWGFIELFQAVGVLTFIISSCTFYAIVQDVKKAHRGWSAIFGIIGATAVELYYSYSHLNLFESLLKGNEYPFNISYQTIALAFTILVSGGSVYAVIMTALRSRADAEEKRLAGIENSFNNN